MTEIAEKAISTVNSGLQSFCRFITANDTGETGAHQSGFYIPKEAYSLFFDTPGNRGGNKDKFIKIKWQDDFETESRAIYYGKETRNEYRLTRFGRGFPLLQEEYTGALLVITKYPDGYYSAFVLNDDADIEEFLDAFGMTPADTNTLITTGKKLYPADIEKLMSDFISILPINFPETVKIAETTRDICITIDGVNQGAIKSEPDNSLLHWLRTEFELFKRIETHYYSDELSRPFGSVDKFVEAANTILNRRKSRAGKSLEHHLDAIFSSSSLRFSHPGKTEGNKKPDFIFPGNSEYHSDTYSSVDLVFLGAKTTCKDRWRQILNEAAKIPVKHLFTLQQGISRNQLKEMYDSSVVLVVPQPYISTYPEEYRKKIFNLKSFISYAEEKQAG